MTAHTRTPPFNADAELAVLAGIILDPDRFDEVADVVTPDDWYLETHRLTWLAIEAIRRRGGPLDTVTICEQLRATQQLTAVGGEEFVEQLTADLPIVANIEAHARIVRDLGLVRGMVTTAHRVAAEGYTAGDDVIGYLDRAESQLLAASHARRTAHDGPQQIGRVCAESLRLLEEQSRRGAGMAGTRCGLRRVDQMTTGFYSGDLWFIGARPGMGKTALALNIAEYVAETTGPAVVFSLEMDRVQLVRRMKCGRARVPMDRLRSNQLEPDDWSKLTTAAGELSELPLIVDDNPDLTPMRLRSRCRRLRAELGSIALIVVDYLQLMRPDIRHESTEREVREMSRDLKLLAKELACPIVALSQLNRECERRSDKRPTISDLRHSGALEQDADVIAFLYRDEVYNKKSPDTNVAEVIVAKQRNGPIGTVRLAFFGEYFRFYNYEDDFVDDAEPSGIDWAQRARDAAEREGRA